MTHDEIEQKIEEFDKRFSVRLVDIAIAVRNNPKAIPIPGILQEMDDWLRDFAHSIQHQTRERVRGEVENKSTIRKAEPADEYERGWNAGYDDKEWEIIKALEALEKKEGV